MAHIELEPDRVSVQLTPVDEVLALHGSLHLPYSHLIAISHVPVPPAWFRGIRVGTNLPGIKVAGTFFNGDGALFYDFHDPTRCLTFALDHGFYKRVVVQVDQDQDPDDLARRVSAKIGAQNGA